MVPMIRRSAWYTPIKHAWIIKYKWIINVDNFCVQRDIAWILNIYGSFIFNRNRYDLIFNLELDFTIISRKYIADLLIKLSIQLSFKHRF